ncbi:hypothetical protein PP175_04585 [Aneurinibacillus sp. Ricciae_BoGa-3]|uniref:hypothetical protein n=1 Tax=Aneurinibacillus sp. Ricciae_BoGa-3 TaxID=3022697 RepID=UPI00233FA088|nr:hypothetical protein [Aneurinibacillus sp. Ricciae_BoGa-3]WCK56727.1 hypothetical protein PP175_04585 [Aneurinibacillus sp. Ricciae_BoGa-3]
MIIAGVLLLAILSWFVWDRQYKNSQGTEIPSGYVYTDEVNIDPVSGRRTRVYYNPRTGDRFYKEE